MALAPGDSNETCLAKLEKANDASKMLFGDLFQSYGHILSETDYRIQEFELIEDTIDERMAIVDEAEVDLIKSPIYVWSLGDLMSDHCNPLLLTNIETTCNLERISKLAFLMVDQCRDLKQSMTQNEMCKDLFGGI